MKAWQRRHFWGVGSLLAGLVPWFLGWHLIFKISGVCFLGLAVYLLADLWPRRRS